MFGIISLQNTSQASFFLSVVLLLIVVFAIIVGVKYCSRFKDVLAFAMIVFALLLPFLQYRDSLGYISNTYSIALLAGFVLCIMLFAGVCYYVYSIAQKPVKSKIDVMARKKAVSSLAFILVAAFSFFSMAFALTALLKPLKATYGYSWIDNVTFTAFFITMAVVLSGNIIGRICSPIYTTDIIGRLKSYNLYLRSFEADVTHRRKERIICRTFNNLFPTYAIGDPNTVLQPLGADRIYATDSEWQDAVSSLMEDARFILIRCALTNGTIWELNRLLSRYQLFSKSVFIVDNEDCYTFIKKEFLAKGVDAEFPDIDFAGNQYGLCVRGNEIGWDIHAFKIDTEKEVVALINHVLSSNKKIDTEYEHILKLRHNPYFKLFSNEIPKRIRRSLNWGILSPIINWRRWPVSYWIAFIILSFGGAILLKTPVVTYIMLIIAFLFGNRLEWTQTSHASVALFLSRQRREALLMWSSMIFTGVMAWIVIMLVR